MFLVAVDCMIISHFRFTVGDWRAGAWASSRVTACDWLVGWAFYGLGMSVERHRGRAGVTYPGSCFQKRSWSFSCRYLLTIFCMVMLPSIVCTYASCGFICLRSTGIWFSCFNSIHRVFQIFACTVQWLMNEDVHKKWNYFMNSGLFPFFLTRVNLWLCVVVYWNWEVLLNMPSFLFCNDFTA